MTGFGKSQKHKKSIKQGARRSQTQAAIQQSIIEYQQGNLEGAKIRLEKTIQADHANSFALGFLATIEKALGNNERALRLFKRSTDISQDNSDILHNYSGLLEQHDPEKALMLSDKAVHISPENSTYLERNGYLKWKAGDLDNALEATLKALRISPILVGAHLNLGGIYKDLGNLDQALASTLKSLELKPGYSKALYSLGRIQMTLGKTEEARKTLLYAIENNSQEFAAYYDLSKMLETKEQASELIKAINLIKTERVKPRDRCFIEFAISNALHKAKNYGEASKHLQLANKNKLKVFSSNAELLQQAIKNNLAKIELPERTPVNAKSGKERIFIVGMPRSGSTLLETILSMNPEIKDLGESRSLEKAIAKIQQQKGCNSVHQDLNEAYSQLETINNTRHKYTTDKQLYNFVYINWITAHMPSAKIIHCRRHPMDNILSMYRSNLEAGNNYTANLEDAAKVLVAQEKAMQIQKKRYPENIFTFDYDQFVTAPEDNLRKLLRWLDLDFDDNYLHPEKSTRSVYTESVMQARKPISNKSVGGWKNYEALLKPAFKIIQESGVKID